MIQVGDPFPEFQLQNQDGTLVTLQDFHSSPVVFFFYPKDDTSGCTVEACEFRDRMPKFSGVRVVGISPDPPQSHKKFIAKYGLNFELLADVDHQLAEACGVWVEKSMYGRKYMGVERSTFLVDASGKVSQIWRKVNPEGHADSILQVVT